MKRKVSRGITVGKPPLHLFSFMQSVHPDGFRGKRPSLCQVSVNATENPICTARKKKEDFTVMDGSEAGVGLILIPTFLPGYGLLFLLYCVNQVIVMLLTSIFKDNYHNKAKKVCIKTRPPSASHSLEG